MHARRLLPALIAGATVTTVTLAPVLALAGIVLEAQVGPVTQVHGDVPRDLLLDIGVATGASVTFEAAEPFALELRYDALFLFGDVGASAAQSRFGTVVGRTETAGVFHGITLGPSFTRRWDSFELQLGVHPGIYVSRFELEGTFEGADGQPVERSVESDLSSDFGLHLEVGGRVFFDHSLFLGGSLNYHHVVVREELDDDIGALGGSVALGYRF